MKTSALTLLSKPAPGEICVECGNVFSFPAHGHTYYEMTWYEPFDGQITVNTAPVTIDTPCVILLTPADYHRIHVCPDKTPARFWKVLFDASALPEGTRVPDAPRIWRGVEAASLTGKLIETLAETTDQLYRARLLGLILFQMQLFSEPLRLRNPQKTQRLALEALRYLHAEFRTNLTLRDTAIRLGTSKQYLSMVFAETVGMSFVSYLCNLRLSLAAQMLTDTTFSVTEICYACGYRNLSHFLRAFRKLYDKTPLQYRKQNRDF